MVQFGKQKHRCSNWIIVYYFETLEIANPYVRHLNFKLVDTNRVRLGETVSNDTGAGPLSSGTRGSLAGLVKPLPPINLRVFPYINRLFVSRHTLQRCLYAL